MFRPTPATAWLLSVLVWGGGCADPTPPSAVTQDCACQIADLDPVDGSGTGDVPQADHEAPDVPPADTQPSDVPSASTPTCDVAWIEVHADHPQLVPPPLDVTLTAWSAGEDLTAQCTWAVGPANVCVSGKVPGSVRKSGPGTCVATCTLQNGTCGRLELGSQPQVVLYVVGGEVSAFPPPPTAAADAARISRLRTADGQWDATVAFLPEFRIQPAVGVHDQALYVLGGETGGNYSAIEHWDVFFPTCLEAIITPTQLKAEVGCRAVRRLDLRTGLWDSPFQWPHPRVDAGWRQIGSKVLIAGGFRAKTVTEPKDPELLFLADLAAGQIAAPKVAVPQPIAEANSALHWPALAVGQQGGLPLLFTAKKTWLVSASGEVVAEKDIGWPCPENLPRAVVRLPVQGAGGAGDDLLVVPSPTAQGPKCPKCPYETQGVGGQITKWCTPLRYAGKQWSVGQPMPYAPLVEAPDGVYALADDATYRLQKSDGTWQPVAPPRPYGRFGAAIVAVSQ